MSLENVQSFYTRLANDESFRTQMQSVNSKDECSQVVQAAGYDFTQEEFEEYTGQLLESIPESELQDLDEQELEAVVGGTIFNFFIRPGYILHYGIPPVKIWPPVVQDPIVRPLYGLPIRSTPIE